VELTESLFNKRGLWDRLRKGVKIRWIEQWEEVGCLDHIGLVDADARLKKSGALSEHWQKRDEGQWQHTLAITLADDPTNT
jgi:hypothetical protein